MILSFSLDITFPEKINPNFELVLPMSDLSLRAALLPKDFQSIAILDQGIVGSQGRDLEPPPGSAPRPDWI